MWLSGGALRVSALVMATRVHLCPHACQLRRAGHMGRRCGGAAFWSERCFAYRHRRNSRHALSVLCCPSGMAPSDSRFFGFRFFDIYKPLPQLERLPGGWGIMLDDLFAGLLAQVCVRLALILVGP